MNLLSERLARAMVEPRERIGISQAELAGSVGVSLNHVSKLEREVYAASLEMAGWFIVELKLDANDLIEAKPAKRNVSKRQRDLEAEIRRILDSLDDKALETAAEVVKAFGRTAHT